VCFMRVEVKPIKIIAGGVWDQLANNQKQGKEEKGGGEARSEKKDEGSLPVRWKKEQRVRAGGDGEAKKDAVAKEINGRLLREEWKKKKKKKKK